MTEYQFTVTIGASALNLAAQAFAGTEGVAYPAGWKQVYGTGWLPACKVSAQVKAGASGSAYIGPSTVTSAGLYARWTLAPPNVAGQPGAMESIESYTDCNSIQLEQLWIIGGNAGDYVSVAYFQA